MLNLVNFHPLIPISPPFSRLQHYILYYLYQFILMLRKKRRLRRNQRRLKRTERLLRQLYLSESQPQPQPPAAAEFTVMPNAHLLLTKISNLLNRLCKIGKVIHQSIMMRTSY